LLLIVLIYITFLPLHLVPSSRYPCGHSVHVYAGNDELAECSSASVSEQFRPTEHGFASQASKSVSQLSPEKKRQFKF